MCVSESVFLNITKIKKYIELWSELIIPLEHVLLFHDVDLFNFTLRTRHGFTYKNSSTFVTLCVSMQASHFHVDKQTVWINAEHMQLVYLVPLGNIMKATSKR